MKKTSMFVLQQQEQHCHFDEVVGIKSFDRHDARWTAWRRESEYMKYGLESR